MRILRKQNQFRGNNYQFYAMGRLPTPCWKIITVHNLKVTRNCNLHSQDTLVSIKRYSL